jgi:two-component system chemotaxis response regulator CheY
MRVLVADDDLVSRLAMEDVLQRCGAPEVTMAEDGPTAWGLLNGEAFFDLVCLDVRMPPPDGLELVVRLRAATATRRVPTMLITSTADRNTVLAATKSDLQGFIVKPVGSDTAERVQRVFAQLDASILEPAATAMPRLRVDLERHTRYVGAFRTQVQALHALAVEAAQPGAPQAAKNLFEQKCDACKTAALTLGAPRIEQVIGDALQAVQAGKPGADKALGQALYWLGRVVEAQG